MTVAKEGGVISKGSVYLTRQKIQGVVYGDGKLLAPPF